MGLPFTLVICLLTIAEPPVDVLRWETQVADRITLLPNPYRSYDAKTPKSLLKVDDPWIDRDPLPEGERHYFEMEESADWMGIKLTPRATAGLQVEFAGPAEELKRERKMTFLKWDPFDPRYVLTTIGLRLQF